MKKQLGIAIIGMGGFAGAHHAAVSELEAAGECRLVCASGRSMSSMKEQQKKLRFEERGVRLFDDWVEMLDSCRDDLDVVAIPTPIQMHAPMHRACAERNLPVYLEKPPTLDAEELEGMIEADKLAPKAALVAFNYIVEPERLAFKQRILNGEFGAVKRVSMLGLSPRAHTYYQRNSWAGHLLLAGNIVLDSPIGNAIAHHAHDSLFWCGVDSFWSWGQVNSVKAELYRAHAIQGTDTVFIKADIAQGPELRLAMTHGCANVLTMRERIECENAGIDFLFNFAGPDGGMWWDVIIRWQDGRADDTFSYKIATVAQNLKGYLDYLRGEQERPMTRLIDCRPFVHLNDLMYLAAGKITTVPETMVGRFPLPDGTGDCLNIQDITPISERFVETGEFPSAQGAPWATPGGEATPADLPHLSSVLQAMAAGKE